MRGAKHEKSERSVFIVGVAFPPTTVLFKFTKEKEGSFVSSSSVSSSAVFLPFGDYIS